MIKINREVQRARAKIQARMKEIEWAIVEYERAMEINEILKASQKAIADASKAKRPVQRAHDKRKVIVRRLSTLEYDELVSASILVNEFSVSNSYARYILNRLEKDGTLEKWGRGKWRRKPDRTGKASLRVLTA